METLGKITLFFMLIFSAFLLALLSTTIILSISNLYGLTFISQFSFVQLYGISLIINLIRFKFSESKKEGETFPEQMLEGFIRLFAGAIINLIAWGFAFLAFSILN